jgi:hypothetical protein
LKVELTLRKTQFYFENVYAAEDIQFLREVNWGQPWVKRHFSLEMEDVVGQGNPLV